MNKIIHNPHEYYFYISRNEKSKAGENYITIADIKKVINSINVLFNNPQIDIRINAFCGIVPIDKDAPKLRDSICLKEAKVLKINNNTLDIEYYVNFSDIETKGIFKYKTKKLNNSMYDYQNKLFDWNIIDSVIFYYKAVEQG